MNPFDINELAKAFDEQVGAQELDKAFTVYAQLGFDGSAIAGIFNRHQLEVLKLNMRNAGNKNPHIVLYYKAIVFGGGLVDGISHIYCRAGDIVYVNEIKEIKGDEDVGLATAFTDD